MKKLKSILACLLIVGPVAAFAQTGQPDKPARPAASTADQTTATSNYTSLEDVYVPKTFKLPVIALKTNVLYGLGTLSPNLAMEIGMSKKTTLELSGSYHPWHLHGTPTNNRKLVHMFLKPEVRIWTKERFHGHFFGIAPLYFRYNIGGYDIPLMPFKKENRYSGWGYGGSVTYGYHLVVNKWFGVEFALGVGAMWMRYDYFEPQLGGKRLGFGDGIYVGPTNAAVNLVFVLK